MRTVVRLACAVAAFAGVLIAANASAQPDVPANACSVHFTLVREVVYSEHRLRALEIFVEYRDATGAARKTRVLDDDGILTLAMLAQQFAARGMLKENLGANYGGEARSVFVHREAIALARGAAQMGIRYFTTVNRLTLAQPASQRGPNDERDMEVNRLLILQLQQVEAMASKELGETSNLQVSVGAGYLRRWIGDFVHASMRTRAYTSFEPHDGNQALRSGLCDPAAPSRLLGRLLCGYDVRTGAVVAGPAPVCPGKVAFSRYYELQELGIKLNDGRFVTFSQAFAN